MCALAFDAGSVGLLPHISSTAQAPQLLKLQTPELLNSEPPKLQTPQARAPWNHYACKQKGGERRGGNRLFCQPCDELSNCYNPCQETDRHIDPAPPVRAGMIGGQKGPGMDAEGPARVGLQLPSPKMGGGFATGDIDDETPNLASDVLISYFSGKVVTGDGWRVGIWKGRDVEHK